MKITSSLLTMAILSSTALAQTNDYPTQARVEYVLACMKKHGGETYDTLYPCVCSIDKIAAQLPYEKYVEIETLSFMVKTPGERGGAFRDVPGVRKGVKEFQKLIEATEKACFVKRVSEDEGD